MQYSTEIKYSTKWSFYVTEGAPLTQNELSILRTGGKVDRVIQEVVTHNIIPTASRAQICKILSGGCTLIAETKIGHAEMGTGTTAPANGDTGLETPTGTTRAVISSASYSSNVLNLTSFWSAGGATGTWREYGTFINGTMVSNSGTLFNRVAINITISPSQSLTIDGTVTFS